MFSASLTYGKGGFMSKRRLLLKRRKRRLKMEKAKIQAESDLPVTYWSTIFPIIILDIRKLGAACVLGGLLAGYASSSVSKADASFLILSGLVLYLATLPDLKAQIHFRHLFKKRGE